MKQHEAETKLKLAALLAREEALKKVAVDPADVDTLVRELDWTKGVAERCLRIAGGDLKALLRSICT